MKPRKHKTKKDKFQLKAKYFAIFFVAVFLAGIFLFGGKIQGYAEGKLMAKGNFYFNGGAYDLGKAAKYYKIAAFVNGKASYPHYQLARVLFMKTDYKDGLAEIDRALALNPENKRAFYIRGLIDGYAGNLDAAADDFQKFIAWAPKEWAGHNDLAWVYFQAKDYQKAADAAQKGLEAVPNNAWLLNGLGVSLEALGENDQAKVALDQAQALSTKLTPADWKRAYPGNNAESAPWDLAQFKTDVKFNLGLASGQNIFSAGKGKFQAACGSSTTNNCLGTSCASITCDNDSGQCYDTSGNNVTMSYGASCYDDCGCGGGPWKPVQCVPADPPGQIPAGCTHNIGPRSIDECRGQAKSSDGYCFPIIGKQGSWCVDQTHDCPSLSWNIWDLDPNGRWVVADACPGPTNGSCGSANGVATCSAPAANLCLAGTASPVADSGTNWTWQCAGTGGGTTSPPCTAPKECPPGPINQDPKVVITKPVNNATGQSQSGIAFLATATDPDAGDVLTVSSIIKLESNGSVFHDASGNIDFTYGPFAYGITYTWTVSASDGKGGSDAKSVDFTIENASPVGSSCACGSVSGICNGHWPSNTSALCLKGSFTAVDPPAGSPGSLYGTGTWKWTCDPNGSCDTQKTCSADGKGHCGWIETNP